MKVTDDDILTGLQIFCKWIFPASFGFALGVYAPWDWVWRIILLFAAFYLAGAIDVLIDHAKGRLDD